MVLHPGTYQSYIEDLKRRKGPDADQPVYENVRRRAGAVRL